MSVTAILRQPTVSFGSELLWNFLVIGLALRTREAGLYFVPLRCIRLPAKSTYCLLSGIIDTL